MKLGIKRLLIFSFASVVLLLLTLVLLNASLAKKAGETNSRLNNDLLPALNHYTQFKSESIELTLLLNTFINERGNYNVRNRIKSKIEVNLPFLQAEISKTAKLFVSDSRTSEFLQLIESEAEVTRHEIDIVLRSLLTAEDFNDKEKVQAIKEGLYQRVIERNSKLTRIIDQLLLSVNNEFKTSQSQLESRLNQLSKITVIVGLFGLLAAIIITIVSIRSVTRPLSQLVLATERLSKGDFSSRVGSVNVREMESLGLAFNDLAISLQESFETIDQKASELKAKNRELEQFAYIASHDLQSPLVTVSNFVQILEEDYHEKFDAAGLQSLKFIRESTARMKALVNGLLDYSRLGRNAALVEINLNELFKDIKDDLKSVIDAKKATIDWHLMPSIIGYHTELRTLFQNLITNGIKFCPEGVNPVISINAYRIEDSWNIEVSDNGIGIPEQHREKIFMIFQRLHNQTAFEGTGIGLAHCQKVAELHGGSIRVESEEGRGSTFIVSIPDSKPELTIDS